MSEPSKSPSEGRRSEAVLGPFTVRDLTLGGGVVITFVASLLPLFDRFLFANLWNASNLFFLAIGVLGPVAAAALFAWRRVEPKRTLRIGSLSVDQFASVVAVLSAAFYLILTVTTLTAGAVVGLLGGLAMLAATTLARLIPPFAADFDGRVEVPAHVTARDAVPAVRRPKPAAGAAGAARPDGSGEPAGSKPGTDRSPAGAVAGGVGGAAAAGAAAAGSAWGAHQDDGAWFPPASGPGRAGQAEGRAPAGVPSADDVAPAETSRPAGAEDVGPGDGVPAAEVGAEPARAAAGSVDVGAADLLASQDELDGGLGPESSPAPVLPSAPEAAPRGERDEAVHQRAQYPESAREDATPRGAAAVGALGGLGAVNAGDGAALEATEAHVAGRADGEGAASSASRQPSTHGERGREEADAAPTDHFGEADGEMYGAPEPVAPVVESPVRERPEAGAPSAERPAAERAAREGLGGPATAVFPASSRGAGVPHEDIAATKAYEEPEPYEAFWFAVSERRTAVDPTTGQPMFELHPGQWILALQDRGREFVVQSSDGRIGVLRELAGIERG